MSDAWAEARQVTASRVVMFGSFAALSFFWSWLLADVAPATSLLVGVASAATYWLLVFWWYCVTIPARIEAETQLWKREIDFVQLKRAVENVMRMLEGECRDAAQERRREILQSGSIGVSVDPEPIHAQALYIATRAQGSLKPYEQKFGWTQEIAEIGHAVDAAKPADAEEALAQLVELQRVIETQLYVGRFG